MTTPAQQLPPGAIDAEQVARHLGSQIGAMSFELAARDVALEQAQRRITELEEEVRASRGVQAEPPAPPQPAAGPPVDELPTTIVPEPPGDPGKRRSAVAEANAR